MADTPALHAPMHDAHASHTVRKRAGYPTVGPRCVAVALSLANALVNATPPAQVRSGAPEGELRARNGTR